MVEIIITGCIIGREDFPALGLHLTIPSEQGGVGEAFADIDLAHRLTETCESPDHWKA